jgi:hypothetical protein
MITVSKKSLGSFAGNKGGENDHRRASFAGPEPVPADRKPTVVSDEHHGAVQGLLALEPDY